MGSHKSLTKIQTPKPLELLHMDLMDFMKTQNIRGKRYVLVMVHDFSRFTFVPFFRENFNAFEHFNTICHRIHNGKECQIVMIRRIDN